MKSHPRLIRYPQGDTSYRDLLKLRKRASLCSSLQFSNQKSQDLNCFANFTSLKRTFRTIPQITLAEKFFDKCSPLLFQIKPLRAIKLVFDGSRESKKSRSLPQSSLNHKNLRIFLSKQRPSQIKNFQLAYKPLGDLNPALQKTFKPISLLVNLENLTIILQKDSPEQLKLSSKTATLLCRKLSNLKSLKRILIKGLWLPEPDHLKYLTTIKKLSNLEQYSFTYDPQEVQLRNSETMRKLENDFVNALEALEQSPKITEVDISIKQLFKSHEKAVYEALDKYLQNRKSSIKTLYLGLTFFDFPKETLRVCGQLCQIQILKIKLCSEYQTGKQLVEGLSYIGDIQNKEFRALALDFSEMNLISFDETLHKSLVKILTSLKNLHEFGLKFAQTRKNTSPIWNRMFQELKEMQLSVKALRINCEFDDDRDVKDKDYFDFLESLSSQKNLESLYLNIKFDCKSQRKGGNKALGIVLQKLKCLGFLKRLNVKFEKGFTHVKLQDMLKLKSLQDLACIPKLWIAYENYIITEYNLAHKS